MLPWSRLGYLIRFARPYNQLISQSIHLMNKWTLDCRVYNTLDEFGYLYNYLEVLKPELCPNHHFLFWWSVPATTSTSRWVGGGVISNSARAYIQGDLLDKILAGKQWWGCLRLNSLEEGGAGLMLCFELLKGWNFSVLIGPH